MSKLKDLVPPLELCRRIHEGEFEDSVFAWSFSCDKRNTEPFVDRREDIEFCRRDLVNAPPIFPAPTLAEIMEADHRITLSRSHNGRLWVAEAWIDGVWTARNANNPATASLRLWLQLNEQERN